MPQHKSCKKRMRTSAAQRLANRARRSYLRNAIRELRATTDKEAAQKKLPEVMSLLDQAAKHNLIHHRNAARNKSRLSQYVAGLS